MPQKTADAYAGGDPSRLKSPVGKAGPPIDFAQLATARNPTH